MHGLRLLRLQTARPGECGDRTLGQSSSSGSADASCEPAPGLQGEERAESGPRVDVAMVSASTSPIGAHTSSTPGRFTAIDSSPDAVQLTPSPPKALPKWQLQVKVDYASNLPRAKGVGLWSCFCIVQLGKQVRRTSLCCGSAADVAGTGDLRWASDSPVHLDVFDRSQLLTIRLMSFDPDSEPYEMGRVRMAALQVAADSSVVQEKMGQNASIHRHLLKPVARCR